MQLYILVETELWRSSDSMRSRYDGKCTESHSEFKHISCCLLPDGEVEQMERIEFLMKAVELCLSPYFSYVEVISASKIFAYTMALW